MVYILGTSTNKHTLEAKKVATIMNTDDEYKGIFKIYKLYKHKIN